MKIRSTRRFQMFAFVMCAGCAASSAPPPEAPRMRPGESPLSRPKPGDHAEAYSLTWETPVSRERYVRAFLAEPLATFLPGTRKLPGVVGTEPISDLHYPFVGSVRLVKLADGNTAEEEVLEQDERHLRYLVGRYTSKAARAVAYGLGEFIFADAGASTRVTWTYRFNLRDDVFPGSCGALGRWFFRVGFLDRDYAEFMRTGRDAMIAWGTQLSQAPPQ